MVPHVGDGQRRYSDGGATESRLATQTSSRPRSERLGEALSGAGVGQEATVAYRRTLTGAFSQKVINLKPGVAEQLIRAGHLDEAPMCWKACFQTGDSLGSQGRQGSLRNDRAPPAARACAVSDRVGRFHPEPSAPPARYRRRCTARPSARERRDQLVCASGSRERRADGRAACAVWCGAASTPPDTNRRQRSS